MTGFPMPLPVPRFRSPGRCSRVWPRFCAGASWRSPSVSTPSGWGEVSDVVAMGEAVTWSVGSSMSERVSMAFTVTSVDATVIRRTTGRYPIIEKEIEYVPLGTSAKV